MNPLKRSVLWLAVADARGHLMRAHLMRAALAKEGVRVDILTTAKAGVDFLAAMGSPAELISEDYRMIFDHEQNLARRPTERVLWRYLLSPGRCPRDMRKLKQRGDDYDLVVNDSFHPALLLAPLLSARTPLVHVYGENMRSAVAGYHQGRAPQAISLGYSKAINGLIDRAFARVEHSLSATDLERSGERTFRLPPLIPFPKRSARTVRAQVSPGRPLAVVYLNPHFRTPSLPRMLEEALEELGFSMIGVGEGVDRPGWRARDPDLAGAIAAADVLITAPGMGCLGQVFAYGTPLLALVSRQPEQVKNLAYLERAGRAHEALTVDGLERASLIERLRRLSRAPFTPASFGAEPAEHITRLWTQTFLSLMEKRHEFKNDFSGFRDQQSKGRRRKAGAHHRESGASINTPRVANLPDGPAARVGDYARRTVGQ